jgi:multiple sugar transport system substrate-binding protein
VASGREVTGTGAIRRQLIERWNAEQRSKNGANAYKAHLVELSGTADQQRSQLFGALQSGSSEYDVVNLDVTWVPEFAAAGLIRPLDKKLVDADVIKSVRSTAMWDGDVYSVPFNSDVGLLFYRRDYLKRAGLKNTDLQGSVTTWPQLRDVISDVNSHSHDKAYEAGWTTQLDAYEGRTVNAIEAFASSGSLPLTDDKGRYTGTAESLSSGVSELDSRTNQTLTLSHAYSSDEATSLADFAAGRTAFLRHWPYAYGTLHQTFEAEQLGVMPLPGAAVLGGQNLAVTKASPRADAAQDLIGYLTDKESERCLLDAGLAATRESAYSDPDVRCTRKLQPETPAPGASAGSGESEDRMPRDPAGRPAYASGTLLTALHNAVQRPRTPYYGAFTQAFIAALEPLFGDSPPSEDTLASDLDKALRKALPTRD